MVEHTTTLNMKSPIANLKGFLVLFALVATLISCEKKEQPLKIRVNQFKQTAVTVGPSLVLSVQQGNEIGGTNWKPMYSQIVGFNYEEGYIYDLLVVETEVKYPPSDGSSKAYQLKQVISKTKAKPDDPFALDLKLDVVKYVNGNANTGYNILNSVNIDCGNLCNEFEQALQTNTKKLSGKFTLNEDGSIKLVELFKE